MAFTRLARAEDAPRTADLAELKREQYKTHAPVFLGHTAASEWFTRLFAG